ncbi:hypothetical protein ACFX4I_01125 [Peribacillus sp. YIM B13472]|uniref:hypothetical protein n=1 Tax=Peribacillus sp. YIM B13472 TaxID=3366297 RepID=UPI00366A7960
MIGTHDEPPLRGSIKKLLSNAHQTGRLGIIDHIGNRAIPNTTYRFINHVQRHKEPFLWPYRVAKAVMDGEVELSRSQTNILL